MPESIVGRTETGAGGANSDPGERECLRCYLMRMLAESGCDGTHRWTLRWRDARAPRATGLATALERRGGYCDCEVIFNAMPEYPDTECVLPCAGVPAGATEPCDLSAAGPACLE